MKKFNSFILSLLLGAMALAFNSCGGDDDEPGDPSTGNPSTSKSELVGNWYIEKTTTYYFTTIPEAQGYYNHEEVDYGQGEYWEFTDKTVTVHDSSDLMNGKPVNYTYNKSNKTLSIAGSLTYTVDNLTTNEMTLSFESSDGKFGVKTVIDFEKE